MPNKSNISKRLDTLNSKDVYSLMLFSLYKLRDTPEYSTLSELVYVLDKESLFNFLSVFAGLTIKVPKMDELQEVIDGLALYSLANIENVPFDEAFAEVCRQDTNKESLKKCYDTICKVVCMSDFDRGQDNAD